MARRKLDNYLRVVRKRSGVSQRELGFLLGAHQGESVSRYEHGDRLPSFDALVAYEMIFGTRACDLFPNRCEKIEKNVQARVRKLVTKLAKQPQTSRRQHTIARLKHIIEERDYRDEQRHAA
jgi:transcriptional regulator with XRE-family HTH domain